MGGVIDVAVYPENSVEYMRDRPLNESVSYIDPDIIVVAQPYHEARFRQAATTTPIHCLNRIPRPWVSDTPGAQLGLMGSIEAFPEIKAFEENGQIDTDAETFLLSDALTVNIDLTKLETSLEGQDTYEAVMNDVELTGGYTHLTPNAGPDYQNDWGDLTVHGVLPGADETGVKPSTEIAVLSLHPDGTVASRTLSADQFGLQRLDQVGAKSAATLRNAGYTSVDDVATATIDDLQQLDNFGKKTAEKTLPSAKSIINNEVYRLSNESLPGGDPVFIDIETDGLSPTMVWLIGVLDEANDQYMSFLATDPDDKGKAVEAFMSWYAANASNRPVIAYNGKKFDFDVLHDHVNQHCPDYSDAWKDAWTFDPYWWAVKQNNAILPGRTNKLEDVAEALGWETDDTGLTGAVVGQRFQRWMQNPCDDTELEWEQHETYCEDDVRALAHVYNALKNADRMDGISMTETTSTTENSNTAQGTLNDF